MSKVYSIYDYLPEEYIKAVRVINNGSLPRANFLSEERALSEAEDTVEIINHYRNLLKQK